VLVSSHSLPILTSTSKFSFYLLTLTGGEPKRSKFNSGFLTCWGRGAPKAYFLTPPRPRPGEKKRGARGGTQGNTTNKHSTGQTQQAQCLFSATLKTQNTTNTSNIRSCFQRQKYIQHTTYHGRTTNRNNNIRARKRSSQTTTPTPQTQHKHKPLTKHSFMRSACPLYDKHNTHTNTKPEANIPQTQQTHQTFVHVFNVKNKNVKPKRTNHKINHSFMVSTFENGKTKHNAPQQQHHKHNNKHKPLTKHSFTVRSITT
jgi:hypothetical protein